MSIPARAARSLDERALFVSAESNS